MARATKPTTVAADPVNVSLPKGWEVNKVDTDRILVFNEATGVAFQCDNETTARSVIQEAYS